jgi:hypothetical protein
MVLCAPACTYYSFTAYGVETEPARIVSAQATSRGQRVLARLLFQDGGQAAVEWTIDVAVAPITSQTTGVPVSRSDAVPPTRAPRRLELVFDDHACCLGTATGWGEVQRHSRPAYVESSLPWKLLPLTLLIDLAFLPITLPGYIVLPMIVETLPRR